jgi:anthranilate synthase
VQIEGKGLEFSIEALNSRGDILVDMIRSHLELSSELFSISTTSEDGRQVIRGRVVRDSSLQSSFTEEERSKQPSLFSLVRAIRELFLQPRSGGCDSLSGGPGQQQFGLVGAFGYFIFAV